MNELLNGFNDGLHRSSGVGGTSPLEYEPQKVMEFKKYRRSGLSEMVPFIEFQGQDMSLVSVSEADKLLTNEEFLLGYIARNPVNHNDMWYVAKDYFDQNLEAV